MSRTIINNGKVFTGDKNEKAIAQNILINEFGTVVYIGNDHIQPKPTDKVIDATGKWVTPGFIDTHTHYDVEILQSPGIKESARHGVTTIVLGSCSVSAIYNNPVDTTDSFARVEAIPREVMLPIMQKHKCWNNATEWRNYLEQLPLGVNVGAFIGHSDIRMKAMGIERSVTENTTATPEEIDAMCTMLNEALDAGFIGMSTMDSPWDKMDGEKYWSHKTPSFYASWKERKKLIDILRERNGILQGAPNLVTRLNGLMYAWQSVGLFRKKMKSSLIAMMDLVGDRFVLDFVKAILYVFNKLLPGNFRMQAPSFKFQVYYDGVDSVMFEEFPAGEALRHLAKNLDKRNDLIKDQSFRESFKKEIKKKFAPKVWHKDLSKSFILKCPDESLVGKNFLQIAGERKVHPVDAFLDLVVQYDKQMTWTTVIANDRQEKFREIYNHPHNVISFSDAGAHLNNMAFYNFPLQMMKQVYEAELAGKPIMKMEKCVWRLTKELADWFQLDGGEIAVGKMANINIINPEMLPTVTDEVTTIEFKEFGNIKRLVNRHDGVVENVLVNGKIIFENNEFVAGYGRDKKFGKFLDNTLNTNTHSANNFQKLPKKHQYEMETMN